MQPGIAPAAGSRGRYGAERQRILGFVEEFAREFNDEAPLSSSVSRAYNLWQRSGIPIEAFSSFMYEARSLTQEHSASVQKTSQKEGKRAIGSAEEQDGVLLRDPRAAGGAAHTRGLDARGNG
jgi:hypothetical protein